MLKIIEVISEIGAGTRGSSQGIDAIKDSASKINSDFFYIHPVKRVLDRNELLMDNIDNSTAHRIKGIVDIYDALSKEVAKTINDDGFPFIVAGDHASAGGTIAGIRMARPDLCLGVIWIDAHADMHSPYTTPSGHVHGMPVATALAEDNLEKRVNYPEEEIVEYWETLKNIGGISPKINYEDLVFIGVRDTEEPEEHLISKYQVKNISVTHLKDQGIKEIVKITLDHLSHCDVIYISFDVDSMDPSVSVGTGTPVSGVSPLPHFCQASIDLQI